MKSSTSAAQAPQPAAPSIRRQSVVSTELPAIPARRSELAAPPLLRRLRPSSEPRPGPGAGLPPPAALVRQMRPRGRRPAPRGGSVNVPRPQFDDAALARLLPDLTALPQWVCWRFEWRSNAQGEPKLTKVPLNARSG